MDMAINPAVATPAPDKAETKAKKGNAKKAASNSNAKKSSSRPNQVSTIQSTIVHKSMSVCHSELARQLDYTWQQIHGALYYATVFVPERVGGPIVAKANKAMKQYIVDALNDMEMRFEQASHMADENGIVIGAPANAKDLKFEVSSQIEQKVLKTVRAADDYLIVVDSLWIEEVIDDKARDEAYAYAKGKLAKIHKLSIRMRDRLVEFRRKTMQGSTDAAGAIGNQIEAMLRGFNDVKQNPGEANAKVEAAEPTMPVAAKKTKKAANAEAIAS